MGYSTDFTGRFDITPELSVRHLNYLRAFAESRRMCRDADEAAKLDDPVREKVNLPIGIDGEFYVGSADNDHGQEHDSSIMNYNRPPSTQPGLWCQWVPTEDGDAIEWDGGEKFYEYVAWIKYIIKNFLEPWGYKLNGTVNWKGEDSSDMGQIVIVDNKVKTRVAKVEFVEED